MNEPERIWTMPDAFSRSHSAVAVDLKPMIRVFTGEDRGVLFVHNSVVREMANALELAEKFLVTTPNPGSVDAAVAVHKAVVSAKELFGAG